MLPPSATLGVAVRLMVVRPIVSLTVVVAAAGFTTRFSKLPPLAVLMVADTLPASAYTSSFGAATLAWPALAPAAIVIEAPLLSVTVTALCAGAFSDAVYVIRPPSATDGDAVSDTVVLLTVSVIAVAAGVASTFNTSKPPPLALPIVADSVVASTYTSSPGAASATVPLVAPAAMVIDPPLLKLTTTGVSAGVSSVAV